VRARARQQNCVFSSAGWHFFSSGRLIIYAEHISSCHSFLTLKPPWQPAAPFSTSTTRKDIDSTHALSKLHFILTTFMIVFVTSAINHSPAVAAAAVSVVKNAPNISCEKFGGSKSRPDEPTPFFRCRRYATGNAWLERERRSLLGSNF